MSAPHPPPGPGEPPDPSNGLPPPSTPAGGRGPSPAVVAAIAGLAVAIVVGIGVVVARSGDDDSGASRTTGAPVATSSTTSVPVTTTSTLPPTTSAPTTSPTTSASTTSALTNPPTTSVPTLPAPSFPADALDLGQGVVVALPPGWMRTEDGEDTITVSDGSAWYAARVAEHDPGDGPAALVQDVVDTFDRSYLSVSYTPVRYRGTVSGTLPADEYRLAYSAITEDGDRLSGAIHAFVRGDGLTAVVNAWNMTDAWPDEHPATDSITDGIERALTDAPELGTAATLPIVAPFRVESAHPLVTANGLAGFTVPPGFEAWTPVTENGITLAGATNGATDVVAISMPAPATVEDVFDAVVGDLDERYPGLVIDTPSPQGTRDGVSRLGAGFAGTLDGRPIAGGIDAWLVGGDTAYAFAYTYYADIELDGSNPDSLATQFAYSAYADSF